MDLKERIANFEKMAQDDPENELGHFSLGRAYLESDRLQEAESSFLRVLQLNSQFSKAYQHLAQTQEQLGRRDQAIATLNKGYEVASARGDVMPRDEMGKLLQQLGEELPKVESRAAAVAVSEGDVRCCRCGQVRSGLQNVPVKGELRTKILENVCALCWREWVMMGTKVINELRLDFAHPQAGEIYDAHMKEFLQLPD